MLLKYKRLLMAILVLAISNAIHSGQKVDRVVVNKADRELQLVCNDQVIRKYKISLGGNPAGHKQQEGDQHTPEGLYTLDYRNADSKFYKSIHISYPNAKDKATAKKKSVHPGGSIMIHGQKNGFGWLGIVMQLFDWTDGCIAVTDKEMDEIWSLVDIGTPIQINP